MYNVKDEPPVTFHQNLPNTLMNMIEYVWGKAEYFIVFKALSAPQPELIVKFVMVMLYHHWLNCTLIS